MNRTGLVIALAVAVVVGVVFAVYPRLDIAISAFFYDRQINLFKVNAQPWVNAFPRCRALADYADRRAGRSSPSSARWSCRDGAC